MKKVQVVLLAGMVLLFLLNAFSVFAQQPANMHYVLDKTGTSALEQVMDLPEDRWLRVQAGALSAGYDERPHWIRAQLPNKASHRLLHIAYPLLDNIHLYFVQQNNVVAAYQLGDHLPFSARPIAHEEFVVEIPNAENLTLYMR